MAKFIDGVLSTEVSSRQRDSPEEKAAKALIKGLNVLTFSHAAFAWPIYNAPIAIRRRFIDSVYVLVRMWVRQYDEASWKDDEEMEFLVDAKRIEESFRAYYK